MGLERVRIALPRGFDIPRGPMREDALDWVKEQEERQQLRQHFILVATIIGRSLDSGFGYPYKSTLAATNMQRRSSEQPDEPEASLIKPL
jgi:hypothetical protein